MKQLREKGCVAQIKLLDNSVGRHYTGEDGKVKSKAGIHPKPDISMIFSTADAAVELMMPPVDNLA